MPWVPIPSIHESLEKYTQGLPTVSSCLHGHWVISKTHECTFSQFRNFWSSSCRELWTFSNFALSGSLAWYNFKYHIRKSEFIGFLTSLLITHQRMTKILIENSWMCFPEMPESHKCSTRKLRMLFPLISSMVDGREPHENLRCISQWLPNHRHVHQQGF